MNLLSLVEKLQKYTNIPRLAIQFETDEYIYMADTMDQIHYIFKNIEIIELGKKNLKIYKDDPDIIENIKYNNKYYEGIIEDSLQKLEENYNKHQEKLGRLSTYEENEDEQRC